ncbi:Asp-tRNA(Asn)/Glu-tRNA(Gln) amidotransferase subunit GatA [Acidithiobacillus thiooxidans]|uniref:Glutamyl-tRNA(Gln) amidotransferase subunit A n=1 Tax=Acidithiobacillus thiooxidans TaxID=930 RepID=A0A1C2IG89_ACITH|nr:Asp-tRNA(Asn)/Glu-tRNA(Gln) amidotransferase subunit GatA [Acidithiobacillus thiooxidans]OCX74994.1 aspartyl/glutamyl-tRNA amidotransferase subunit A [Acidithiobacillus thiooxidans]OCX87021.1 aspartyl/glutamyl-tRNA amidotransferase subunit A [Acidithiobacillus thiooxidans]
MDLHEFSLRQLREGLQKRDFSAQELTQTLLKRIHGLNPELNAFITVTEAAALESAARADDRLAKGESGTLLGLPIAHKDIFCTADVPTTCGSKMLKNFVAPYSATVVERLDAEGMVMLGKLNMDEFAMGSSNETSYFGPVRNPWNTEMVPGGSSGGSAAAVAAGLVPVATGTDTGGSIRQPAALCGITGIKPTYGRVSRYGMIAFASSLDQGGAMARSAEDCALLLNAMVAHDPRDSTSHPAAASDFLRGLDRPLQGLRVGVSEEFFGEGLDPEVAAAVQAGIDQLAKQGASIQSIRLPNNPHAVSTYYVLAPAEASSNLSRFDGVRYTHRSSAVENLDDLYRQSRYEGFGAEVRRRILVGTYVLSAGYYDAYYLKAQQVRSLIREDFRRAFAEVDVIVGPTTPGPAFALGAKNADPISMYLADIYTIAVNLAGIPALSLPCGFTQSGLPIGMQLMGDYFADDLLLNVAHRYQQETDWHLARPNLKAGEA